MSMTDPVADYLTRIRNAAQAKHRKVDIPASTLKLEMTKILHEFKYIQNFIVIACSGHCSTHFIQRIHREG